MILQALKEYYDRKAADPDSDIAPYGFEWKEISFIIVLDEDGNLVAIEDTRENQRGKPLLVPKRVKRTSGKAANLLWDRSSYALGQPELSKNSAKDKENAQVEHALFVERVESFIKLHNLTSLNPLVKFLSNSCALINTFAPQETVEALRKAGTNISFRLAQDQKPIPELLAVFRAVQSDFFLEENEKRCLITGDIGPLALTHFSINNVEKASPMGADIVSFNLDSSVSYGKKQGENAPVSRKAAFEYQTALDYLLRYESNQKISVCNATITFWAELQDSLEDNFAAFFAEPPKDDPDRGTNAVKALYGTIESGVYSDVADGRRFYILGLVPVTARLAISLWVSGTVQQFNSRLYDYFQDLELHSTGIKPFLPMRRLLLSLTPLKKKNRDKEIPPKIAGDLMRSVLEGLPYPRTLLQAAVRRDRADQNVSQSDPKRLHREQIQDRYARAALIKACINRGARHNQTKSKEEIQVALNPESTNPGYTLGRLFAVLEKLQIEAHSPDKPYTNEPPIGATIRDRYYGAASSTPTAVFATLIKLSNYHLSKLKHPGRRVFFEKLLQSIISKLDSYPSFLDLENQGRFSIGYYHQKAAFYTSSKADKPNPQDQQGELEL